MTRNELLSVPAQEYHAEPGCSASMLDLLRRSPAHLKASIDGELREESDALSLGVIVHRYCLEPETVEGAFHVKPDGMSFATKDGKAWREACHDRPIISAEHHKIALRCRDNLWREPVTRALLSGGYPEQSLFVEDGAGTLRKSRYDYIATSGNVVPDLKTTRDASADEFERAIARYWYWVRAAYYLDNAALAGIEKDAFVFICVETDPPYSVAIYQLADWVIEAGRSIYRKDLQVYRNCIETGKWPGYHSGIREIGLPAYLARQLEEIA